MKGVKHTQDKWKFGSSPQEGKGHTSHLGQLCLLNMLVIHYLQWFEGFYTVFSGGTRVLQNMFETFHWKRN